MLGRVKTCEDLLGRVRECKRVRVRRVRTCEGVYLGFVRACEGLLGSERYGKAPEPPRT